MLKTSLIVIGFLIVTCVASFSAQAPSQGPDQQQLQAAELWSGQ